MPETRVPGVIAKHAVITDACRAAHTDGGAFNKAVMQLLAEYSLVTEFRKSEKGVDYHLVLTVEDTKKVKAPVVASNASHCCHLECAKPAAWVIVSGPTTDDVTEACTEHVGELLNDAPEQRVCPLSVEDTKKKPALLFGDGVAGRDAQEA